MIFSLFNGTMYLLVDLLFQYLNFWVSILLLGTLGSWLIFKMAETVVITIPLMRFRIRNGIPSFIIAAGIIITLAYKLFLHGQLSIFDASMFLEIVGIVSTVLILLRVNKYVDLNRKFYNLKHGSIH